MGTEIKVSLDAKQSPRRPSGTESVSSSVDIGRSHSVTFLGFDDRVRGLKLLRDVLEIHLSDWDFAVRPSSEPGWGDILLINESDAILDHFTEQNNVSRPVVIFSTSRSAAEQMRAANAYVSPLSNLSCSSLAIP